MIGLAIAGIVAGVASVGSSIYQGYTQAQAKKKSAEYNADVMLDNAELAELQAAEVERGGALQQSNLATQIESIKSDQIAARASSGVDIDSGSALDMLIDTISKGGQDIAMIGSNVDRETDKLEREAKTYKERAALVRKGVQDYGFGDVAGSILSQGSNIINSIGGFYK